MARFNDGVLDRLGGDLLSDGARAQHRNVLIVASFAILIGRLNLVPHRISAVGVPLHTSDRNAIRVALIFAVAYLLIAFWTAAYPDLAEWRELRADAQNMRDRVDEEIPKWEAQLPELKRRALEDTTETSGAQTQLNEARN